MNELTQFLVDSILNEDKVPGKTALFGGGFKPPTRGHLEVVTQGLKDYPEVDEVYVFVGSGVRNNISQEEALKIWEMYKPFIPVKTTIVKSGSPLKDIKRFIEDVEGEKPYVFIGARPNNDEDDKDVAERSKFFEKYGGIPKRVNTSDSEVSGTAARKAAKEDDKQKLYSYFPDALTDVQKEEIYDMLRSVVKETSDPDDGKAAPFGSGYGKVNENASYSKEIDIKGRIDQLTQHMINKGMNIEPLPAVEFVDGDTENARDFFGKTAYYEPNTQTVVLYTEGRHPKDIVRSYAHEMIHHIQNLEGRLGNITTTNTQEDDHLNDIEAEANLKGTMTFRNWTDSLNEVGDATQKPYSWTRKVSKDPDDGLIEGVDYRFTTDLDTNYIAFFQMVGPMEYEFGFNIPGGNQAQTSNKGELFRVMATMVAIMKNFMDLMGNDWSEISFSGSKDPSRFDDNRRDKLYMAYIKKHLPPNITVATDDDDMTVLMNDLAEGFNKKLGKDPFGLNAYAYELAKGLEETILNEGRYDKFVNQLSRIAFEAIKDGFESGRKVLDVTFTVRPPEDEPDIESDMFEFDFQVVADYTKDVYKVDGGANEGIDDDGTEITPLLIVNFGIPKNPKWSTVSMDLKDVVRHELEHLTQSGDNVVGVVRDPDNPELNRPGKQMADDQFLRDMIDADTLPKADYFKLEKEIDAMMQGLYFKAKKSRRPFKDVIDDYLATQPISKEDKEVILDLWRSRNKALNLPVFENNGMADLYTIYLDMDGVIVNFDKQFEDAFGMPPREFEEGFGIDMFWKKIEERGVGFWRGMEWMPGGEALYNRIAQHDHFLLSSPSKSDTSKIGKHMWKKDKTPNTKLILSRSYNKKNYADKSNILIDDRESNIQQWRDAGGIGILYKSAEQVNAELDKLGL